MKPLSAFLVAALTLRCALAPAVTPNPYGLNVVSDMDAYRRIVRESPSKRLVDVSTIPGIRIDVRYATADNFMKQRLYPVALAFLRIPAAAALASVQRDLEARGLGLKVFDAYRPYSVTVKMWEPIRNPDFVADPAKGSRHNRGAAVDLTLVDLATGRELPMPTPYDDFSPRARQDFAGLPPETAANRAALRDAMQRHGFEPLSSEWWHFDFRGWEAFELLDLKLEELPSSGSSSVPEHAGAFSRSQKRVTIESEPTL